MSHCKDELPGFYKDPKTGKYYREKPGDTGNPSLKKLKKEREESIESGKSTLKFTNVLKYLRAKELGPICGLQAEREYLKMRTYHKWMRQNVCLNDIQPHNIVSVDFIKGGTKSIFGIWNIKDNSHCRFAVGEQTYLNLPDRTDFGFKACNNYGLDLCEGPDETVVYLYNNHFPGLTCFVFFPRDSRRNLSRFTTYRSTMTKSPLFCCSAARSGSTFAYGSEGFISFYNMFSCEKTYFVNGKVHTISFDEASNLMVSGVHNGVLYVHDIRLKKIQAEMKVSSTCLNDSYFLDPNQVILAGPSSKLCKVDLRMQKIVTEYLEHKHPTKKRPFSVANNMLCATGVDNITRIWHLSGGNPIHEMKPLHNRENNIRGWLYSDCNKTYLYHFEEAFKTIFEIV